MKWGEAVTLEFVKTYLKHECLWNPEHPHYKMRHVREKSYKIIATEFEASTSKTLTVPEVKVKIKNLRTTYIQMVHKILQKSSAEAMYEPSLVWFHEMDRCLKHIPINRHSGYNAQQAPEIDSSCQIWVDNETQNEKSIEENPDPLISQTDEELLEHQEELRTDIRSFKKMKKKKLKRRSTHLNSEVGIEDEFDIYGKFIASQLRQMDLQKALRLQLEIQSLVSEARISDLH